MADIKPLGGLGKLSAVALLAAVVGIALFVMGMNEPTAWQSFHFGFVTWTYFTAGCLGMSILVNVTRGTWGYPLIRFFDAGAKLMPVMFLGALVMLAMKSHIFPWANPDVVASSAVFQQKTATYLSDTFFNVRTVIYFAFWTWCAFTLSGWLKKEDQTGDEKWFKRRTVIAAPMAVFFVFTLTAAATDWVMSLEEFWFSTIYGLLITVGCCLSAMAAASLFMVAVSKREPFSEILNVKQWRDMGNLVLTMVILWGYMSFSQFLIIWSGNLPEEIVYFVKRREGAWLAVGTALVWLHFALPFFLLLSSRLKRTPWMLGSTMVAILILRFVDLVWQILPSMGRDLSLVDVGAFLGIGGVWFFLFAQLLAKAEPTPRYSLRPKEAIEHA